jgi:hypothetical protein
MNVAIAPRRPELLGILNENPAPSRDHTMLGKVAEISARRPKVSIVQMAGQAKAKLTRPKPHEARSAARLLAPVCENIVAE